MSSIISEFFLKSRVLMVIQSCNHCRHYKEFIERVNQKLPFHKRIKVIDCTNYHDFGIIEDNNIRIFQKYMDGSYPTLFFEGVKIVGSNTREETEAWIMARVNKDFLIPEHNKYLFEKDCKYDSHRRVICN